MRGRGAGGLVEVAVFATDAEARLAASLLASEGIDAVVSPLDRYGAAAVVGHVGSARVRVPAPEASRARELLEAGEMGSLAAEVEPESPESDDRRPSELHHAGAAMRSGPADEPGLAEGLAEIRRRRRHVGTVLAGGLALLSSLVSLPELRPFALYLAGAWVALLLVISTRAASVRCPRCGGTFGGLAPVRACPRCGLPLRDAGDVG